MPPLYPRVPKIEYLRVPLKSTPRTTSWRTGTARLSEKNMRVDRPSPPGWLYAATGDHGCTAVLHGVWPMLVPFSTHRPM